MARRLALLIGNTEYDDPNLARLKSPAADVNNLAGLFRESEIGGFDEVVVVINQTAASVRRTIAQFFSKNNRDDLLLLYFSGHGVLDDRGRLHLAVKDSERDLLSATAIEAAFITDVLDSFSRRQVLVLDFCHSGAFAAGAKGVLLASVGTASAFEGKGYGQPSILHAVATMQDSYEKTGAGGMHAPTVFQERRNSLRQTLNPPRVAVLRLVDGDGTCPSAWAIGERPFYVDVHDGSSCGLLVRPTRKIAAGQNFHLFAHGFPEKGWGCFTGQVRWVQPDPKKPEYHFIGCTAAPANIALPCLATAGDKSGPFPATTNFFGWCLS